MEDESKLLSYGIDINFDDIDFDFDYAINIAIMLEEFYVKNMTRILNILVDLANEMDISNMKRPYEELDEELWKRYSKLYNEEGKFN